MFIKSLQDNKIVGEKTNPITLVFRDRDLEKKYRSDLPKKNISQLRLAHILAIIFYNGTVFLDSLVTEKDIWFSVARAVIVTSVFLAGFLLTYLKKEIYCKTYQYSNILYVLLTRI